MVSPETLRQLLRYDPETGHLFWLERRADLFTECAHGAETRCAMWNARWAGKRALAAKSSSGHLMGRIFYRGYLAHRVAWAMHFGSWPGSLVDHINRDRQDNRIANLREADSVLNARNSGVGIRNKSGHKGVLLNKKNGKWLASIGVSGRSISLGHHDLLEDAISARAEGERRFGFPEVQYD